MKFPVTITNQTITYDPTVPFDTKSSLVVLNNQLRRIERVPLNKAFDLYGGDQQNVKATYCLYLENNDPFPELEADVSWQMQGRNLTGKVKFIYIYARIITNIKAEVYIQSDND
jgi:hypothetical protein